MSKLNPNSPTFVLNSSGTELNVQAEPFTKSKSNTAIHFNSELYMFISNRFSVTTHKTDILEQSRNFINARNIMSLPISNINKYSHNLQLNHVLFSWNSDISCPKHRLL